MNEITLLGVSDGFALFGGTNGLTVVVGIANLDVFDPIPKLSVDFSRWNDADPAQVPTEAFELADNALGNATRVEGTDVIIAAGAKDKRSFAIPKAAQAEAQKALMWRKEHGRGGTEVGLNTARTLAKGGSVGIQKVRHISKYFARHAQDAEAQGWSPGDDGFPSNGRIAWALWGGDAARRWAEGIAKRERDLAVLTSLDFDSTSSDADPEPPAYTPGDPHVYVPDALSGYACEVCGGDEFSMEHTVEEGEPEAADDTVAVVAAVGGPRVATSDEFFNVDIDAEDPIPDFYVELETRADGVPSMITDIYAHQSNDTWVVWSKQGHNWSDHAEPSDVQPVDEDSAYEIAILFDTTQAEAVPAQEVDGAEWSLVQSALPDLQGYEEVALSDIEFCVVMESRDKEGTVVIAEVFLRDNDETCWRWNPVDVEWQQASDCPKECMPVDEKTAREDAARLASEAHKSATSDRRRGTFKPVPGGDKAPSFRLPGAHGQFVRPPNKSGTPFEFDQAFARAAWIKGTGGGITDGPPGYAPGRTSTSFSAQELNRDGNYTPEERSANAAKQPRNALGRFSKSGDTVHVKGSQRTAKIVAVDEVEGMYRIKYSDGTTQWRNTRDVVPLKEGETPPPPDADKREIRTRDNIVREARSTDLTKKASLPYALPILSQADIELLLTDYAAYIKKVREQEAKLKRHAALDPTTSDVAPLYLAQVDELDKQAVVELIALVPMTKTSNEVFAFVRSEGGWTRDDKMLARIKSTSPPPLVTLDHATYKTVVKQVDSYFAENADKSEEPEESAEASITAALRARMDTMLWSDDGELIPVFEAQSLTAAGVPGIADTPGDVRAARRLRNYWLRGRGAAKIRWNTGGDWTRCVRHLSKYMGVRARGYCQNLHKSATGMYTGDKKHRKMYGRKVLSSPTVVLTSADDITAETQFLALLEVDLPDVTDLANLTFREPGHKLRVGERFLANGGDGIYTLSVLEPTSIIGWEGEPAVLVGDTLLREQDA